MHILRSQVVCPKPPSRFATTAKRQQSLAQSVSPGFDFTLNASREAAADAINLPPLRGCDIMNAITQRLRAGLSSHAASRLWADME